MVQRCFCERRRWRGRIVLSAAAGGASARSAGARFGVGMATAIAWVGRARRGGGLSARKQGKPPGSRLDPHEAFVVDMIEKRKDITLNEMVGWLAAERDHKEIENFWPPSAQTMPGQKPG